MAAKSVFLTANKPVTTQKTLPLPRCFALWRERYGCDLFIWDYYLHNQGGGYAPLLQCQSTKRIAQEAALLVCWNKKRTPLKYAALRQAWGAYYLYNNLLVSFLRCKISNYIWISNTNNQIIATLFLFPSFEGIPLHLFWVYTLLVNLSIFV